jgi:hypothetical protein
MLIPWGARVSRAYKPRLAGALQIDVANSLRVPNLSEGRDFSLFSIGLAVGMALTTCGCAHFSDDEVLVPRPQLAFTDDAGRLQCVPYARDHSGIRIFGDAYTWWDQAAGRYARSPLPREKAVIVFVHYAGNQRAHLAVVHQIISGREIRIDHANWFDDGKIYVDDPVEDISAGNDWSLVRVWNMRTGSWGKAYDVRGFIWPPSLVDPPTELSSENMRTRAIGM